MQKAKPDGFLLHEDFILSLFPLHGGMRQYWRDWESLERWARSEPHRRWWQDFLRDSGGTGFWHETYFRRGGFEAIYDDMPVPIGMMKFAPLVPARGPMFSAGREPSAAGDVPPAIVGETDLYGRVVIDARRPHGARDRARRAAHGTPARCRLAPWSRSATAVIGRGFNQPISRERSDGARGDRRHPGRGAHASATIG